MELTSQRRDQALRLWREHHRIPEGLGGILEGVVHGYHGSALAARLGIRPDSLPELELAFSVRMGQSVYEAASDILNAAYTP